MLRHLQHRTQRMVFRKTLSISGRLEPKTLPVTALGDVEVSQLAPALRHRSHLLPLFPRQLRRSHQHRPQHHLREYQIIDMRFLITVSLLFFGQNWKTIMMRKFQATQQQPATRLHHLVITSVSKTNFLIDNCAAIGLYYSKSYWL